MMDLKPPSRSLSLIEWIRDGALDKIIHDEDYYNHLYAIPTGSSLLARLNLEGKVDMLNALQ